MASRTATRRRWVTPRFPAVGFVSAWLLAVVLYGVGDGATTLAVVASPQHLEANPILASAIANAGTAGLLAVKAVAVGGCLGLSLQYGIGDGDRLFTYGPPALLVAIGAVTTLSNLALLT